MQLVIHQEIHVSGKFDAEVEICLETNVVVGNAEPNQWPCKFEFQL